MAWLRCCHLSCPWYERKNPEKNKPTYVRQIEEEHFITRDISLCISRVHAIDIIQERCYVHVCIKWLFMCLVSLIGYSAIVAPIVVFIIINANQYIYMCEWLIFHFAEYACLFIIKMQYCTLTYSHWSHPFWQINRFSNDRSTLTAFALLRLCSVCVIELIADNLRFISHRDDLVYLIIPQSPKTLSMNYFGIWSEGYILDTSMTHPWHTKVWQAEIWG